jgi:glycosyltransferase involved in cell wall biosynthesis
MMPKLTALIPCKNERRNIRPCIQSLQPIADEILVADSGSTDGTLDIVRQIGGCRIIEREYVDSGNFKNWAIPQASHPWVLIVDADERLTESLAEEIQRVLSSPSQQDGYWIYRTSYFMGHRIRFSGWQHDRVLRLFRRDLGRYGGAGDHAEVVIPTGNVGRLRERLQHYTYWSYDQYFRKFTRYTTWQAERWHREGRRASLIQLLLSGPLRFLRSYVLQLGFLDGRAGLQICALAGFYSFMKRARLWELNHALEQPDPEAERSALPIRALGHQPKTDPRPRAKKAA